MDFINISMDFSHVSCAAHSRQHPTHQVIAPRGDHQPQSRPRRVAAHDLHRLRHGQVFAIAQVLGIELKRFGDQMINV